MFNYQSEQKDKIVHTWQKTICHLQVSFSSFSYITSTHKQNNRYLLRRHIRQLHYSTQHEVFSFI